MKIKLDDICEKVFEHTNKNFFEILKNQTNTYLTPVELYNLIGPKTLPKIIEYEDGNLLIKKKSSDYYELFVDNVQWMTFSFNRLNQLFEVYSHYNLAEGHCICTGLGFGLREQWLLCNPRVTKITVIEKCKNIINYHKQNNPELLEKLEIINCDASDYIGSCDTLLLDHYELEPFYNPLKFFDNVKKCTDQISHKILWIWPLEKFISKPKTAYKIYHNRIRTNIKTLPNLSEKELISYCNSFYYCQF